ncbi:MAG: hypothetical protein ABSF32_09105 [Ignavibacteria bacterium]|jgi:hypothetical protein
MKHNLHIICILLSAVIFLSSCSKDPRLRTPDYNWYKAGNKPASYEIGKDEKVLYNGQPTNYLRYTSGDEDGFGSIMKDIKPGEYLGRRVKLTGYIKSENIESSAGMWMRVDGTTPRHPLGFDNMQNRPIRGTNDWTKYGIVLDVPQNAVRIFYGVLITGKGQVWFNDISLDTVSTSVPTTDMFSKIIYDTISDYNQSPDKLQYIPDGIIVKHIPDSVYASKDAKDTNNYYWFHKTTVKAESEDLEITEFGSYTWYQNNWVLTMITDKPFTKKDFADWYNCPDGKLIKGKVFEDNSNWYRSPQLQNVKVLWYYIGKNAKGEKFKGTAMIEYLAGMKKK